MTKAGLGATGLIAAVVAAGVLATDGGTADRTVDQATFRVTADAGSDLADARGTAKLVVDDDAGSTTLRVDVRGLVPSASYESMLHVGSCDAPGEPYAHGDDPSRWDAQLGATVTADGAGRGIGERQRDWVVDSTRDLAVVLQQGDAPLLCAEF